MIGSITCAWMRARQWADEARNRADAVREKLKEHASQVTPLLSPARVSSRAADPSLASEADPRIEEYLHEAVRSWLPQAFPEAKAAADPTPGRRFFFGGANQPAAQRPMAG